MNHAHGELARLMRVRRATLRRGRRSQHTPNVLAPAGFGRFGLPRRTTMPPLIETTVEPELGCQFTRAERVPLRTDPHPTATIRGVSTPNSVCPE